MIASVLKSDVFDKGNRRYWAPLEVFLDTGQPRTVELVAARLLPESGLTDEEVRCPEDCACDSLECESMCGRSDAASNETTEGGSQ